MYTEELEQLKRRKIKKILEQEFQKDNLGELCKSMNDIIKSNTLELKKATAKKNHNQYVFITVNPKPGITFQQFRIAIIKLAKRAIFDSAVYCFEQRGAENNEKALGDGFHCHMLCVRNLKYKPSKIHLNVKNSCKKLVGNVNNQQILKIQICGADFAVDKLAYIKGEKTGDGKLEKCNWDKVWREQEEIDDIYSEGPEFIIT